MDYKQKFIEYYQANIHREGADRLLEWLQTTDFFHRAGQHPLSLRLPQRLGAAQR